MNKIKQINISDFRIYQEKQEFKFQNVRGIANLVALYAPNGYGKTSFFDAVEWGYSDKIGRIGSRTDNEVQELDHNENLKDKIILTNRLSYKKNPNARGRIEFVTEKGNLKKEVTLYTRKNTNGTKNDYKEGKVSGNLNLPNGAKLVEFNVLSQDQIDRFLRYLSPEEKFNELKDFWTEGEETLNKYKNIEDTLKSIDRKVRDLKVDKSKLKDELKQIVFDPQKLDEINKVLEELEKEKLLEYKFSPLKEPLSKESFEILSRELNLAEKGLEKRVKNEENSRHQLEQLILKFPLYKGNLDVLKSVTVDIGQMSEKQNFFDNLKAANKQKDEIDKQLQEINEKLFDYRKLANKRISFLEIEKEINDLKKTREKNNRTKQRIELDIAITDKWISSFTRHKSNLLGKATKYQTEEERFKLLFERYVSNLEINKKDKQQLPLLDNNIKEIKKEIESDNELIRKYQNYIVDKNWVKENFETTDWQEKVDEYKLIFEEFKIKKEDLKEKKEKLEKSGSLEENLNRIKLWGKEYVEKVKHKNCPLCHSPFENFEALIREIDENKEDLLKISDQTKKIGKLEETIGGIENKINDLNQFFITKLNDAINKIKEKIASQIKLKEKAEKESDLIHRRAAYFKLEYKTFIESIKDLLKEGEEYCEENIPRLIERLTEKKNAIDSQVKRIQSILDWKYEFSEARKNSNIKLIGEKSKTEKDIFDRKNNETYKLVKELLAKYEISKDRLDDEKYISSFITGDEKVVGVICKTKEGTIRQIDEINNKIKSSKCKIEQLKLEGVLAEKERLKLDLEKTNNVYEDDYKKLFVKPTYSVQELESALLVCNKNIQSFDNYEKIILPVITDLEFIEKGLRKQKIEKLLQDIEDKNVQLDNLKGRILSLRDSCMVYIQKGISNYFNKDVINQIYQRIEPHPELKEIDFKAKMGKNGKPKLIITTRNEEEEINPNLFLSAGQVNVLSLSIFLAKAFDYGQDTISTIFMDDPIQNLSDVNILSFIDILRTLTNEHDKQIVISTHDEKFFRLLQNKLPEEYCNSKYIEFESEGKIKLN